MKSMRAVTQISGAVVPVGLCFVQAGPQPVTVADSDLKAPLAERDSNGTELANEAGKKTSSESEKVAKHPGVSLLAHPGMGFKSKKAAAKPVHSGSEVAQEHAAKDEPDFVSGRRIKTDEELREEELAYLDELNKELDVEVSAADTETALQDFAQTGEMDDRHLGPMSLEEVEKLDFSMKPFCTYRERDAIVKWMNKYDPCIVDPDNVKKTSLLEIGMRSWELVPGNCTSIMFPSERERARRQRLRPDYAGAQSLEDQPFEGPLFTNDKGEAHPAERISTRVRRGRFDPMKERTSKDHVYPDFTDLYVNKLDTDVSTYLITDAEWTKLLNEIIQPTTGPWAHKYPLGVPHDFDMWKEPVPVEGEVHYGVPLTTLTHPYDWHIFRADIGSLVHEEVDRIIHISQGHHRNHKKRDQIFQDTWAKFSIRLVHYDHGEEVVRNRVEERALLGFYKGRRHATDFFHRHHRKQRTQQIISQMVDVYLQQFPKEEVERYKRFQDFIERERVSEEVRRQKERNELIEKHRAGIKWYLVPWYMLQSMFMN